MDFNFFEWVRDGVDKSSLLAASDTVEQIATSHMKNDSAYPEQIAKRLKPLNESEKTCKEN